MISIEDMGLGVSGGRPKYKRFTFIEQQMMDDKKQKNIKNCSLYIAT